MPVTWAEVAAANGKVMHAEVQFDSLVNRPQPGLWDIPPDEGTLPAETAARLAAVLARHTTTPSDCWFAVWDGWAGLAFGHERVPTFELPGRRYVLLHGPVSAVALSIAEGVATEHRSPNLWWPSDKSWCVATEVDLNSTYLGASEAAVTEVLATPGLEALRVRASDRITADSDHLNGPASV